MSIVKQSACETSVEQKRQSACETSDFNDNSCGCCKVHRVTPRPFPGPNNCTDCPKRENTRMLRDVRCVSCVNEWHKSRKNVNNDTYSKMA